MPSKILLVLCLVGALAPFASAQQHSVEELRTKAKQLTSIVKPLQQENAQLRAALEKEFPELTSASTLRALGQRVEEEVEGQPSLLKVSEALQKALKEKGLTTFAGLPEFWRDICEEVADEMTTGAAAKDALEGALQTVIRKRDFTALFAEVIRPAVAKDLIEKETELRRLEIEIEQIERSIAARAAGVPGGMVRVPAHTLQMGVDRSEVTNVAASLNWPENEVFFAYRAWPRHEVEMPDFYIDTREVTNRMWREFLKEHPEQAPPGYKMSSGTPVEMWPGGKIPEGHEDRPVTGISQVEALAYATWIGRRLPTEEEWEAAARYSEQRRELRHWPWGDHFENRRLNAAGSEHPLRRVTVKGLPPVTPVGTFLEGRSSLGIFDMAGNAAEWTMTKMKPYPGFKPLRSSDGKRLSQGDFNDLRVVVRGGHALNRDVITTTWWRNAAPPEQRFPWIGFRCASSVDRTRDRLQLLLEHTPLSRQLIDFEMLPSDEKNRFKWPQLNTRDRGGYAGVIRGGWDYDRDLPARAERILVAARDTDDLRDQRTLDRLADEKPLFLGYLELDVPSVKPEIPAGAYFVMWQGAHRETIEVEYEDRRGRKKTRRETKVYPSAVVLRRLGTATAEDRVLKSFDAPKRVKKTESAIEIDEEKSRVTVKMAFPQRGTKRYSMTVGFTLQCADGALADFR